MNTWTPSNIFDHKGKQMESNRGKVKLYLRGTGGGWNISESAGETLVENVDIWTACRILNNIGARPCE